MGALLPDDRQIRDRCENCFCVCSKSSSGVVQPGVVSDLRISRAQLGLDLSHREALLREFAQCVRSSMSGMISAVRSIHREGSSASALILALNCVLRRNQR
jgi:hypothetical protein